MKKPKPVAELSLREAKTEHEKLGREIAAHDKRYYQDDAPVVSDAEYDALRRRYEALERAYRAGEPFTVGFILVGPKDELS